MTGVHTGTKLVVRKKPDEAGDEAHPSGATAGKVPRCGLMASTKRRGLFYFGGEPSTGRRVWKAGDWRGVRASGQGIWPPKNTRLQVPEGLWLRLV